MNLAADDVVVVGDLIRFSVALLEQIREEPDGLGVLVEVTEIRREVDDSKVLVLQRAHRYIHDAGGSVPGRVS